MKKAFYFFVWQRIIFPHQLSSVFSPHWPPALMWMKTDTLFSLELFECFLAASFSHMLAFARVSDKAWAQFCSKKKKGQQSSRTEALESGGRGGELIWMMIMGFLSLQCMNNSKKGRTNISSSKALEARGGRWKGAFDTDNVRQISNLAICQKMKVIMYESI